MILIGYIDIYKINVIIINKVIVIIDISSMLKNIQSAKKKVKKITSCWKNNIYLVFIGL